METVYRIYSKVYVGEDEIVFATRELAIEWYEKAHAFHYPDEIYSYYSIEPIELRTS